MNRKRIFNEVQDVLTSYCEGCFVYSHHRKELGRNNAHKFCITNCTVGQKLKTIGKKLS
ncbi:zinc-finger domain-containing protein [Peribacillus acanthi]|uniref:zinc-finger domain-containing protein n=1 Tax=Peribacillus acanthi TaxID=2171554 RepID=UPI000D3E6CB9|nr:zinc-finger domain-containing protein [Peribacillus acanthi]